MARTASEISRSIRAQLAVLDPDISTEPLTPERKIIDTVAEVVADAEVDTFVLDYQYNVDTKVGADLDKFVALFGFARQGGRRGTGTVTFQTTTASITDTTIPAGTQVIKPATSVSPAVIFRTVATVTLYTGTLSVDAPIESTNVGAYTNVPANSITSLGSAGTGTFSSIFNTLATSGGTDLETDAELRIRFKNTIFRNISGTTDQYLALALSSRFTNKANVVGPQSRFIEYVQTLSTTTTGSQTLPLATINVTSTAGFPTSGTVYIGGQAVAYTGVTGTTLTGASGGSGVISAGTIVSVPTTSQIPYSKYTYNFDYFLTDGNIASETFYNKSGVDYTFLNTIPPKFYVNNGTNIPSGSVVLLEHAYTSLNSRNDPATNILNYVDVFVAGRDLTTAVESTVFPNSGTNALNNTSGSAFYRQNFRRVNDGSVPLNANVFQELLWQPVSTLPSTITLNGITYTLNTHYWLVKDITVSKGSRRARNGIEWSSTVNGSNGSPATTFIAAGYAYQLTYTFNKLPLALNELMESHKQVTADVLVHEATNRYFKVYLTIMYSPGYSPTSVDQAITTTLTNYFANQQFGVVIQLSDIIEIVHEVVGVDNVRITTSTDAATYGVREVAADGTTLLNTYTSDFALQDADLPVLNSIVTLRKSQNTWG
jgi:uncharacterized phage protein gp47/JayE